jgi:methylated-DNA-[protein]-cysteine S-methyltransferase
MDEMDLATHATPIGPFVVVALDGVVHAAGWTTDPDEVVARIHLSRRPTAVRHRRDLGDITKAVEAYHDGDLTAIDAVPVAQAGSPFLQHAWDVLRDVPPGQPVTYLAFAERCGHPGAVRAAGGACARNAPALFVPCHRVVRSDGTLGGFRWGLPVKQWLLDHEAGAGSETNQGQASLDFA